VIVRVIFAGLLFASFLLACALPTFYGEGGFMESGDDLPGFLFVIFGPLCGEVIAVSWAANPCFLVAVVLLLLRKGRYGRSAILFGCLAFLLSLLPGIESASYSTAHFQSEPRIALAFGADRAKELRIGYFVWVSTHWHMFVGAGTIHVWDRLANRSRN
jgi:hypothetical protein